MQRSGRAGRRAGLTLIELLLVMALLAIVLGMGLGAFTALDLETRTVVAEVQNTVRSANNWAQARSAPARVRIDRGRGALRAEGLEIVGTWHFEALPIEGAFELRGSDYGAELDPDGFQGNALSFTRQSGAHAELHVAADPGFDLSQGFHVQCALRHDAPRGGRVLTYGRRTLFLEVTADGALAGGFESRKEETVGAAPATDGADGADGADAAETVEAGTGGRSGAARVESEPDALPLGRWARVALSYDRNELVLAVDGVVVARSAETSAVASEPGVIVLSDQRRPFPGSIDSLVVGAVVGGEEVLLPEGVRFSEGTPAEIGFAAGGGLDRARHAEPLAIGIELADGVRRTVAVGLYGTVE